METTVPKPEIGAANWGQTLNDHLDSIVADAATKATHPTGMTIDTDDAAALVRLDNTSPVAKRVLQIRQDHNDYALKIDHYGTDDAVNIVGHNTTDPSYTVVGINGMNTDLGTLKVVNNAAQAGGAVIAGWGTDPARTAPIFIADNWGQGNGFQSYHRAGSAAIAFRAAYDGASTFTDRAIWIPARHTAGALVYVENPVAHTSGAMLSLYANNAGTTVPLIQLTNDGTGYLIDATADGFAVDGSGFVRTGQLFNITSFNNSKIQLATTGTQIVRNIGDGGVVLQVKQDHASGTGDLLNVQTSGSVVRSRFNKGGYFMTKVNSAPADADVGVGEMALWFDSTNGAAKLMIKAKEAGGTVRTAQVALA